jgi:hypothetical protein
VKLHRIAGSGLRGNPDIIAGVHYDLFFPAIGLDRPVCGYRIPFVKGEVLCCLRWDENREIVHLEDEMPAVRKYLRPINRAFNDHQFPICRSVGKRVGKWLLADSAEDKVGGKYGNRHPSQQEKGHTFLAHEHD